MAETVPVDELVGMLKYVYVRPALLAMAKERFGASAVVATDWRLDIEDRDWYLTSCPVPVPDPCRDVACLNPLGDKHPGEHVYLVDAE